MQFNVELDETDVLKDQLRIWRTCDATENRPPPLIIETYLDTRGLTSNQSLVILDENGKRWDVKESLAASHPSRATGDDIILERWRIELGGTSTKLPADLGSILPTVYKKSIVLFRSLFTYSKFLPAWKFVKRNRKQRANPVLQVKYRILNAHEAGQDTGLDHLTVPLYETSGKVVDTYSFGTIDSPAGPFSVGVTYRTNCDFRVDDSEALLSSRFMGADDEIFRPSLPLEDTGKPEVGSLPVQRPAVEDPDPSRAYGSLSTFHHIGPPTGTSPLSALRMVRDNSAASSSPGNSPSQKPPSAAKMASGARAAALAGDATQGRRPSVSFQPFKAPPLSASPSLFDPPLGASPRSTGPSRGLPSEKSSLPTSVPVAARKSMQSAPENAIVSSNSTSPRPAPISRYSSAFTHRRGRLSAGGSNKVEDDTSSGKASAASSAAQPGSGLLTEPTGTSADSIHADDENISEFLKMLDMRKDLMNPTDSTNNAPARKTTATSAALTRFQRMRDSNAALSDSMSSSVHMHRSSNSSSKQLSGIPPMAAGTSISTASSPGKPISPHTPHTPAIPSRLSSHSIVAYNEPEAGPRGLSSDGHESPMEDNHPSGEAMQTTAIDIPRSPYLPAYTGNTGSGPGGRISGPDDDDDLPFPIRSVSVGDRHTHSLSAMQQQQQQSRQYADDQPRRATHPSSLNEDSTATSDHPMPMGVYRDSGSHRGGSGPTATSSPSNNHMYMPRFGHIRGRGSSGGPRSLSSGSGSLARGGIPQSFPERDHEGNASGSNSGGSTMEVRRGSDQRPSSGRTHTQQQTPVEEDEPLLFAMSDFGTSRRSLEEGRHGNHGADSSGSLGSRRGSGRRGMGPPGFHVWS